MIIGNILTTEKISIDGYNIISDLSEKNNNLPTLIIGGGVTKAIIGEDNLSILNKKIDNTLFWTFDEKERKVDFEVDIKKFREICLDYIEKQINYIYVDVLHDSRRKLKKIINKIISLKNTISYINNNNMLYIFSDNLVFGVDLNICDFIGIKKEKITNKIKSISVVTLQQNEIFNKCKELIKNNREKIIPYIYYNGTNNENSNLSILRKYR